MVELNPEGTTDELYSQLYCELRRIAQRLMLGERLENTLTATALVNESYLRFGVHDAREYVWHSRAHFVASAAEAMRRVLIDRARAKNAIKRSCTRQLIELDSISNPLECDLDWLLDIDSGLTELSKYDSKVALLVKLHLFAGQSIHEAGQLVGLTRWASYQGWEFAVAWFAARSR